MRTMSAETHRDPISDIRSMKSAGLFDPYIEEIIFPHYKNLERGLSIQFDFPVTALIGQNGTNKSSVLRALQSCPDQNSISDYWFDTDLDHIDSEPMDRQRYIHKYRVPSGNIAEVIKIRIQKEARGWDYFETAKPRLHDGMHPMPEMLEEDAPYRAKTRWRPIKKNVVYIDFRAQLPAFDILMSYQNRTHRRDATQRKALVRLRAGRLNDAINGLTPSISICGSDRLLSEVLSLNSDELKDVGLILGRSYKSIKLVKHDLYDYEGWTAKLESKGLDYTEAFAGSGEFAAISIVHELYSASMGSLVLLDEPETSLHPGAQAELCNFLIKMCKIKHLQIVVATHSNEIISNLPADARKLLGILPSKTCVSLLSPRASLEEAFSRLGADFTREAIYVEDKLAAELIKNALRAKGLDAINSVEVKVIPGGAQTILTRFVPVLADIDSRALIVLDGDQRPDGYQRSDFDSENLPNSFEDCVYELERYGISKKHIPMNGGNDRNTDHQLQQMNTILAWIRKHVRYLPGKDPEGLLLSMVDNRPIDDEQNTGDSSRNKAEWCRRARAVYSKCLGESINAVEILNYQKIKLAEALSDTCNYTARDVMRFVREVVEELFVDNV